MRGAAPATERLPALLDQRREVLSTFLAEEGERIARACHDMARAFARGGMLFPFGTAAAASDAAHVAVEFMHPVIVGKRALPAVATTNDVTGASDLAALARAGDIAMGIAHEADDAAVERFLAEARSRGLLTLALGPRAAATQADHRFSVPSDDPQIVQEVQETAYHVLWELVHVFFEHPGLLDDACITCGDVAVEGRVVGVRGRTAIIEKDGLREEVAVDLVEGVATGDLLLCHAGVALERLPERPASDPTPAQGAGDPTAFLYPFLEAEEADLDQVLADVRASTLRKGSDVLELQRGIDTDAVDVCARAVQDRLEAGGRLIAFGNGGSSTDAQDLTGDCLARGWPAVCLTNDVATVTAVSNDVGFDNAFGRQLIALAREGDVAVAITTSGSSPNVVAALEEARRRQMLTVAITGYDGGRLAELDWLDHLFVVRSDYVPRLQEVHATIYHLLLEAIGERR